MTHTPGPWSQGFTEQGKSCVWLNGLHESDDPRDNMGPIATWIDCNNEANARLIASAPDQHAEMVRYLPVLERAEADPVLWELLTQGLGIATLNGYRAAIAKATNA